MHIAHYHWAGLLPYVQRKCYLSKFAGTVALNCASSRDGRYNELDNLSYSRLYARHRVHNTTTAVKFYFCLETLPASKVDHVGSTTAVALLLATWW